MDTDYIVRIAYNFPPCKVACCSCMCLVVAFFLVVSLLRHAIIIDHEIQWLSALNKCW